VCPARARSRGGISAPPTTTSRSTPSSYGYRHSIPELPEIEAYRTLAERALHRAIKKVDAPDGWYLKGGLDAKGVKRAITGRSFIAARRIGKLLVLDTDDDGPSVGLRFGMSGRLLVDDVAGVDQLLYSSNRVETKWDRFTITFADGGQLLMRDPRRLGGVALDPDEARLGVDARSMTLADVRAALGSSTSPLKARLLDQKRFAGVGNLIADEVLFRAGLDPRREARSLSAAEQRRLHKHLTKSVADLIAWGGSHTGAFRPHRAPGGRCPKDGTELLRATVGGRTTWWCPQHQV
jgi:formamidopyrimidine-DNA glycosylase